MADAYLRFDHANVGYVLDGLEDATVRYDFDADRIDVGDTVELLTPGGTTFATAEIADIYTAQVYHLPFDIEVPDGRSHPATDAVDLLDRLKGHYPDADLTLDTQVRSSTSTWWPSGVRMGSSSRGAARDAPWRDEGVLRELYLEKGLSSIEIGDRLDCGTTTVLTWLEKHGIDRKEASRNLLRGHKSGRSHPNWNEYLPYRVKPNGYEVWSDDQHTVMVHRLAAVAWFGFEKVVDNHVHHKNGIPWDNRKSNVELVSPADHIRIHEPEKDRWGCRDVGR